MIVYGFGFGFLCALLFGLTEFSCGLHFLERERERGGNAVAVGVKGQK